MQGDIIESGSSTSFGASHKYDAWGAVTETVLGSSTNAANFQYGYIFGYRGYQYDKETGLYYCQSRYYNSRIGRFLSADDTWIPQMSVGDLFTPNLYLYGDNNPVMNVDPNGFARKNVLDGPFPFSPWKLKLYAPIIWYAGDVYLKKNNLKNTRICWKHAFYGDGKALKNPGNMVDTIKKSEKFKKALRSALKNKTSVKKVKVALNFGSADNDLYLSLGKIDFYVTGTKTNGKWNLTITGSDTFDFDEIRTISGGFSAGNAANDFGVFLQEYKAIKKYKISLDFKYNSFS